MKVSTARATVRDAGPAHPNDGMADASWRDDSVPSFEAEPTQPREDIAADGVIADPRLARNEAEADLEAARRAIGRDCCRA